MVHGLWLNGESSRAEKKICYPCPFINIIVSFNVFYFNFVIYFFNDCCLSNTFTFNSWIFIYFWTVFVWLIVFDLYYVHSILICLHDHFLLNRPTWRHKLCDIFDSHRTWVDIIQQQTFDVTKLVQGWTLFRKALLC